MSTTDKGQRLVRLARDILVANGYRVELAPNVVRWVPRPTNHAVAGYPEDRPPGRLRPISMRHDWFGIWDLMFLNSGTVRAFAQVTTLDNVAARRKKILASGFPAMSCDCLLGYVPGRARHFRVYRGPTFERWEGECWRPVAAAETAAPPDPVAEGRDVGR